jgi:predicted nucleotidyltransferase
MRPSGDCGADIMKAKGAVRDAIMRMVEKIRLGYDPERIILFGSYAYGNPTEHSDIDLLIIKDDPRPPIERRLAVRRLLREENRIYALEVLVYGPRELSDRLAWGDDFLEEIVSAGEELYATSSEGRERVV